MGVRGSILVNDHMETSAPDVYAVGDAVQVKHLVTGEETLISLAGPANKQGRIAADNICGIPSTYRGSQGSSVIKVFDITAASTGVNETVAKASGLEADHVILSPMSHAGYYPGGKLMTMKVVFEKETYRLLGAQIVGYEGVDKRIDVLATAIFAGLRATELKDLDLAYAPPYSSAKDPVNMAGFMIENIEEGIVKQWYLGQLEELQEKGERGQVTLLDVRTPAEIAFGRIPGFMNIPLDSLRDHLDELDPAKPIYVICQSGLRSYVACRILAGYGFDAFNFAGGYRYFQTVVNDRRAYRSSLSVRRRSVVEDCSLWDKRYERSNLARAETRACITKALVKLTQEKALSSISVTELCQAAGVSRHGVLSQLRFQRRGLHCSA